MPDSTPPASNGTRNAILIAVGIGLAGLGVAAGMSFRSSGTTADATATAPISAPAGTMTASTTAAAPATTVADSQAGLPARPRPVTQSSERRRDVPRDSRERSSDRDTRQVAAAVCNTCGVIESVHAVEVQGSGTGLGAVAGGVLGGVVGHQMGGGRGKDALTVLGAIGGGLAGNEVEKRQRSQTRYQVDVRMDDGSARSFTLDNAPAVGSRVKVDANGLHLG